MNQIAGAQTSRVDSAGFTLHLPLPPSVNTFRRDTYGRPLGNLSNSVKAWIRQADAELMLLRPRPRKIEGPFTAELIWDWRFWGKRDSDNQVKPLLDWLQRVELINDDRKCLWHWAGFGNAPAGCRIIITAGEEP